jgi:predicted amidophosphoribosyltransferase
MEIAESHRLRPATAESNAGSRGSARKRLAREGRTLAAMIACYCEGHHHANGALCPECRQLLDYAALRLDRCRFGAEKPVCAKCPVHCYQSFRREQIRTVMRYAGPRMLLQHPILSLSHWLDGFRPAPAVD